MDYLDEEEDHYTLHARETTFSFFLMYLSVLTLGIVPGLPFFQSDMLTLFFSGLLLYLVGMKRRTNRCVACKRDNSHFSVITPEAKTISAGHNSHTVNI